MVHSLYSTVMSVGSQTCQPQRYKEYSPPRGYLASGTVIQHGYGSSRCPWVIRAQPGQTINITLHNYARAATFMDQSGDTQSRPDACYELAGIRDGRRPVKDIVGCASDPRTKHVLISTSSTVEIHVKDRLLAAQSVHFMFEYRCKYNHCFKENICMKDYDYSFYPRTCPEGY